MNEKDRLTEIGRLIAEFNEGMRALTDGEPIPQEWKQMLLGAVQAKPKKKPGAVPNYAAIRETVKLLTLDGKKIRSERSKSSSPKKYKEKIAAIVGTNLKAVERVEINRPHYPSEVGRLGHLDPEMNRAYIDGIADALTQRLGAHDPKDTED